MEITAILQTSSSSQSARRHHQYCCHHDGLWWCLVVDDRWKNASEFSWVPFFLLTFFFGRNTLLDKSFHYFDTNIYLHRLLKEIMIKILNGWMTHTNVLSSLQFYSIGQIVVRSIKAFIICQKWKIIKLNENMKKLYRSSWP